MSLLDNNQNKAVSKIKCLCIGDSLALPRDGVLFSETWLYKCQQILSDFIVFENRSQWAQTTNSLKSTNYLEYYQPEIVVIHLGIVDCAPRKIFESYYIKANSLIIKFFLKYILWKIFNKRSKLFSIVKEKQYESNIRNYLERCKNNNVKKVILISTCPPAIQFLQKNPSVMAVIEKYNSILYKLHNEYEFVEYVSPIPNDDKSFYLADGYHVNIIGHNNIFETIYPILKSTINLKL